MSRELVVKKCLKCGAIVKVVEDCNCPCGIECCGEEMKAIVPNSVDAAIEKHVPVYEVKDGKIKCIESDKKAPRKQHHTAHKIYERLVAEYGFEGCEASVRRTVAELR